MSETDVGIRLAELLAARISHDLSGVVGTLAAALELAADEKEPDVDGLRLAVEAASELRQRVRLFRAAWGPAGDPLDLRGLQALSEGLPCARQVSVDLSVLPAKTEFAPLVARSVLNLLLLAAEALPGGGRIVLAGSADDLLVRVDGPRAAWPSGLARCLVSEAEAWASVQDARSLQVPLTALFARSAGRRLSMLMGGGLADPAPMLRLTAS